MHNRSHYYLKHRHSSHNRDADIQLGFPGTADVYDSPIDVVVDVADDDQRIDVLGLGQAMIDFSAAVGDSWLDDLQVNKSSRKLITVEERAQLLHRLDAEDYAVSAGGSLSNTLMALARLGAASHRHTSLFPPPSPCSTGQRPLRVAMAGLIGNDPQGSFYAAQMQSAGVDVVSPPTEGCLTGTVVVLTSPDAQRTMLSYLGTPAPILLDATLQRAISRSSVLVIEGYLWELPGIEDTICQAIAVAQRSGCVVAMTAGDAGVVQRHGPEMWRAIHSGIDLLFTNAGEAAALVECEPGSGGSGRGGGSTVTKAATATAEEAALALGPHCSLVCVTDGANGSVLTALGQLHVVPPHWTPRPPIDTCGAGDAYAAGLLLGFLRKYDVNAMGRAGARAASAVIHSHGATMTEEAARGVAASLPIAALSMEKVGAQVIGR